LCSCLLEHVVGCREEVWQRVFYRKNLPQLIYLLFVLHLSYSLYDY
jgi:hypothetical protein